MWAAGLILLLEEHQGGPFTFKSGMDFRPIRNQTIKKIVTTDGKSRRPSSLSVNVVGRINPDQLLWPESGNLTVI